MKKTAALAYVLLKTVYFNPFSNPLFVGIALLFLFFNITNDLNAHHALLTMYGVGLSHRFIGVLGQVFHRRALSERHGWLPTSFLTLPVSRRQLAMAFVCASALYITVVQSCLAYSLYQKVKPVDLKNEQFIKETTADGDIIRKQTGLLRLDSYPYRGQYTFVAFIVYPSYILDPIAGIKGWIIPVFGFFLLFSMLDALLYFNRLFNTAPGSGLRHTAVRALRIAYYLLGIAIIVEVLLPHRVVRHMADILSGMGYPIAGLVLVITGYIFYELYRFIHHPERTAA